MSLIFFLVRALSCFQESEPNFDNMGGVPSCPMYLLILCSEWMLT